MARDTGWLSEHLLGSMLCRSQARDSVAQQPGPWRAPEPQAVAAGVLELGLTPSRGCSRAYPMRIVPEPPERSRENGRGVLRRQPFVRGLSIPLGLTLINV